MGKVNTPEARAIALLYRDNGWTYFALKALIAMKPPGYGRASSPTCTTPMRWSAGRRGARWKSCRQD
jgi:hypothetical protein